MGYKQSSRPAYACGASEANPTSLVATGRGASDDLLAHLGALNEAGIGVLHSDGDHCLVAVNARFCELLGRTAETLEGASIAAMVHADDKERCVNLYRRHRTSGEPFRIETCCTGADGEERRCELRTSFRRGADGRLDGVIVVALDVTEQRAVERTLKDVQEHHRNTVELAPQINWTADPRGLIEEASPRWAAITGTALEDALGVGWLRALHPEDIAPTVAAWTVALEDASPVDVEYRLRTADGDFRWFRSRAAARLDAQGRVVRWYGTLENIDDRRRAERALRESEERFRLAAQAAKLGIWDYDAIHDRREWSDEFKAMLGLPRDAAPDVGTALALVVPEDRHLLQTLIGAVRAGDSEHRFEVMLRVRHAGTGEERWMRTSGWRIEAANGRLARVLVTIRDVTEEHTAEQRIRWTATHDALTRLPNRAYFTEQFDAAIERSRAVGTSLALVLFDVDNLKTVNDTIGHDAGDFLLLTFARRLTQGLGAGAVIGRLGGDEFAAFIEVDSEADAVARIEPLLDGFCGTFGYEGVALDCQATAGASLFPGDGTRAKDLLKAADVALYAGKAGHRGTLAIYRPAMRETIQRRTSMLAVARSAVQEDRVLPFYQPKIDLADGRIIGFEALLRWRDDVLGIQNPATIAAAFDDFQTARLIGERMLDRICRDVRRWLDRGVDVGTIALNLSPAEFRREDLFERVMERLHRSAIPPALIELEITETVFLGKGADAVAATLEGFHREGMRIALDDFGTGYASLTHLQAFPVDVLKIDRGFVANIMTRAGDAAIVDAVIGLALRLGMSVVAEGVETQAQADYLVGRGCTFGQGYLFGRAVDAEEVEAMMSRRRS